MSDNKHRGPWLLRAHDNFMDGDDLPPLEIIDCDGEVIACNTSYYPTELDAKYAHLIAAAPELYELLRKTEEMFDMHKGIDEDEYIYRQEVRAILAKSRGEDK